MHNVESYMPTPITPSSTIVEAAERYIQFLQSEENKSPLTISNYRESLSMFRDLCPVTSIFDISKESIRLYKQKLHEYRTKERGELGIRTKNHHLTILRSFLRYLIQEEELDVYPPDRIKRFKEEQRKVKVLFEDELLRLLNAPDAEAKEGRRDKAILHLFFSTGLRLAELCSLNTRDINFKTREISVRGKRGKIRVVFLSDGAVQAIQEYLDIRLDHLSPLFIARFHQAAKEMPPGESFRLSRYTIYKMIKKYASQAGIMSNPSPHTLRHSFATNLLRNGADLRSVQELLGHKDLSTTQIYTHVTNPQLKDTHKRFHSLS
jgi:site-specific recombinase XerD